LSTTDFNCQLNCKQENEKKGQEPFILLKLDLIMRIKTTHSTSSGWFLLGAPCLRVSEWCRAPRGGSNSNILSREAVLSCRKQLAGLPGPAFT